MAKLTKKLFRNYFGGSWQGRIVKNGEFQREIIFNWPIAFEKYTAIGTEEGLCAPPGNGFHDNTNKVCIAGWQKHSRTWRITWFNEFGGYGETQWTSQENVNGVTVLFGFCKECKQESDDLTHHIVLCEMTDQDNFKYRINSFKKGLVEIEASRIRTAEELKSLMIVHNIEGELFTDFSKYS